MLDSISELITKGLKAVLGIFPDSPFIVLNDLAGNSVISEWLGYLNWFVPINTFVAILEGWLACIAMYYVWQIILRKLGAIE